MPEFRPINDKGVSLSLSLTKSASISSASTGNNNGDGTPSLQKTSSTVSSQTSSSSVSSPCNGTIAQQYLDAYRKGNTEAGTLFVTALSTLSLPSPIDNGTPSLFFSITNAVPSLTLPSSSPSAATVPTVTITRSIHKDLVHFLEVAMQFADEGTIELTVPILSWIYTFILTYPSILTVLHEPFIPVLRKLLQRCRTTIKEYNPGNDSSSPSSTPIASPVVSPSVTNTTSPLPSPTKMHPIPPMILPSLYHQCLALLIDILGTSITYHIQQSKVKYPRKYSNPAINPPSVPYLRDLMDQGILHEIFAILSTVSTSQYLPSFGTGSTSSTSSPSSNITPSTTASSTHVNELSIDALYRLNLHCIEILNDILNDTSLQPKRIHALFFSPSSSSSASYPYGKINLNFIFSVLSRFVDGWKNYPAESSSSSLLLSSQSMVMMIVHKTLPIVYRLCRTKSFFANDSVTITVPEKLTDIVPYLGTVADYIIAGYYKKHLAKTVASYRVPKTIDSSSVPASPSNPYALTTDELLLGDIGALTLACLTAMCNRNEETEVYQWLNLSSIVTLLSFPHVDIQTWCICYIGWMSYGEDSVTQQIIDAGLVPKLIDLLYHPSIKLRSDAAWTLSNIAMGPKEQSEAITKVPLSLKKIFNAYLTDHIIVRYDILHIIEAFIKSRTVNRISTLLEEGVINLLGSIFKYPLSPYTVAKLRSTRMMNSFDGEDYGAELDDEIDLEDEPMEDPESYATKIALLSIECLTRLRERDSEGTAEILMVTENIPQILADYLRNNVSLRYEKNEIQVDNMNKVKDAVITFLRRYFREALPPNMTTSSSSSSSSSSQSTVRRVARRSVPPDSSSSFTNNRFGGNHPYAQSGYDASVIPSLYRTSESNDYEGNTLTEPYSPSTIRSLAEQTQSSVQRVLEALHATSGDIQGTIEYLVVNREGEELLVDPDDL